MVHLYIRICVNRLEILDEQIQKYMDKYRDRSSYMEYLCMKKYGYQKIEPNFKGTNVLKLGRDSTATSSILIRWSQKLTIVDIQDHITALSEVDELVKNAKCLFNLVGKTLSHNFYLANPTKKHSICYRLYWRCIVQRFMHVVKKYRGITCVEF